MHPPTRDCLSGSCSHTIPRGRFRVCIELTIGQLTVAEGTAVGKMVTCGHRHRSALQLQKCLDGYGVRRGSSSRRLEHKIGERCHRCQHLACRSLKDLATTSIQGPPPLSRYSHCDCCIMRFALSCCRAWALLVASTLLLAAASHAQGWRGVTTLSTCLLAFQLEGSASFWHCQ